MQFANVLFFVLTLPCIVKNKECRRYGATCLIPHHLYLCIGLTTARHTRHGIPQQSLEAGERAGGATPVKAAVQTDSRGGLSRTTRSL